MSWIMIYFYLQNSLFLSFPNFLARGWRKMTENNPEGTTSQVDGFEFQSRLFLAYSKNNGHEKWAATKHLV